MRGKAFQSGADLIQPFFDPQRHMAVVGLRSGDQRVETGAQVDLFLPLTVVPWPPLQSHDHGVIADEMRAAAMGKKARIGGICAHGVQLLRRMDACAGKGCVRGRPEIADR